MKMAAKKTATKKTARSVLVTTSFRGVFWGNLEEERDNGRTVVLTGARSAIRWRTTKGFIELAEDGPNANSTIGARALRITLYDVTSVTECTDAAAKAWEKA